MYDKLVAKVNNIDTSGFALINEYDTDKSDLEKKISDAEKKIPGTSGLVKKKTDYNAEISEIEDKIPSISGLVTNAALTQVENKIPDITSLVKKKEDDNTKISEIGKKVTEHDHDKNTTTPEFNKLTAESFAARLAQVNLITKTDFDTKLKTLNKKINSKKIKTCYC